MTNLLKIDFYQHSFELINVGFDYKYSDIKKVNAESPISLNSFAYYFGVNASLMKYKNFGMDIGFLGYFQRILNSEIEFSRDFDPYYVTDATLFYHPRKKKQNMIFLRFKSMYSDVEQDFFSQLQFGYKSSLKISGGG